MTRVFDRLVHLGNVVIDLVLEVPALPARGGDVLATGSDMAPGGGFNVMAAAARQDLPVVYAGAHGTGPFGDRARAALAAEGISVLRSPKQGIDTGFVVSLVDAAGERTFVTSRGAEATLTADDLEDLDATARDAVYLTGYGLLHPSNQRALLGWLRGIDDDVTVVVDPGPLGHLVPADRIRPVLARADWWSCNAREATDATGLADPAIAAAELARRTGRRGVIVRTGPAGCFLAGPAATSPVAGGPVVRGGVTRVPGFPVRAVDTNGAGDAHVGAFIAALATGVDALTAARTANAAAALAVTARGPATAPTTAELTRFLRDIAR